MQKKKTEREWLTWSEIGSISECEQRWVYEYEWRLGTELTPVYFLVGRVFHAAMAVYWSSLRQPDCLDLALQAVEDECDLWLGEIDRKSLSYNEQVEEVALWRVIVRQLVEAHQWRWGREDEELEVLYVERLVHHRLRNPATGRATPQRDYAGLVDLVVQHPDGRIGAWDHKCQATVKLYFILDLCRQLPAYRNGCVETFGVTPSYVMYNVARKPTIKPHQKESLDDYEARLHADIRRRPEFYFAREGGYPTPATIEGWKSELWRWHRRVADVRLRGPIKNTGACKSGFGGACAFTRLCIEGGSENEEWLRESGLFDMFTVRPTRHEELEGKE